MLNARRCNSVVALGRAVVGSHHPVVVRSISLMWFLILLILLLSIGAFPAWPYSTGWGYYPSGGFGLLFFILLILLLAGRF